VCIADRAREIMKLLSTIAAAVLLSLNLCAGADTVLDDQFCQVFYSLGLGDDGCPAVRANVRSEVRGRGTPTLELGDPSKPALLFFHGWPDTSAMWANQFARFCGDDGDFFCVAPSLQDYHPDFPRVNDSELLWSTQVDKLHAVVLELGLTDITLVVFDFGAYFGYHFAARFPELVLRVVGMDIGFAPVNASLGVQVLVPSDDTLAALFSFQQLAISAFLSDDDELLQDFLDSSLNTTGVLPPPCVEGMCEIAPGALEGTIGARTAWLHYNWVRTDFPWPSFFEEPVANWEFTWMPTFPADVPYLFMWASAHFLSPGQLEWIDARGEMDGVSEQMQMDSDHWFMIRLANDVNDKLAAWFAATDPVEPSTTMIEPSTTIDSEDPEESGDDAASICTHVALFISMVVFVMKI